ncbi:phosphoglycerate dehydrogenase-like enzyme [Nakamurella sp. UYEF19]|uniref:D-2-hydroxyacid dehydrogenase n=1 Tax=Nakamurella sp. UYEF19 TaxID=1756392 RepID=UPI00339162FA
MTVAAPVRYLSTLRFDDAFLQRLQSLSPRLEVEQITADEVADVPAETWAQIDILHTSGVIPSAELAPRVRWVQLDTSGADHLRGHPIWDADVAITTLGGVGPVSMAEYVLFGLLGMAHRLPALVQAGRSGSWPQNRLAAVLFTPARIRGTTMTIVGYGRIGQEVARLAAPFGIRVVGLSRSGSVKSVDDRYDGRATNDRPAALAVRELLPHQEIGWEGDEVLVAGIDRLDDALPLTDWLVVVVPRTPETFHLLDASCFQRLPSGAVLINASRGGIVDESALLAALRRGQLAGAVLDVFESEPLAPQSFWWSEPGVFITPHVAGRAADYAAHVEHIVTENLTRFLAGRPMTNVLDRERGY